MAEDKYYINCTYKDKDEAKLLGARWDPDVRKWYIPQWVLIEVSSGNEHLNQSLALF